MRRTLTRLACWWEGLGNEDGGTSSWRDRAKTFVMVPLSLVIVPGLVLVPVLGFASSLGAAWLIVAKAFVELWIDRLLAPATRAPQA